jgi:hypothetical protein
MSARLTLINLLALLAALASSAAYGEEPAAGPRQFILRVRFCEGEPYRNDGLPMDDERAIHDQRAKGLLRVLSGPDLLLFENRTAHVMVGGIIASGVKEPGIEYGTILDARAKGKTGARIQLDFVAEYSTIGNTESIAFEDGWRRRAQFVLVQALLSPRQALPICAAEAVLFACESAVHDDSEVSTVPTEKAFGRLTMKPGVVYRVFSRTTGPAKSWWEFKIRDVKQSNLRF